MGDVMETVIAILVGICLVLSVENTIKLHTKKKEQPRAKTREEEQREEEEKADAENWKRVMGFHGRDKE